MQMEIRRKNTRLGRFARREIAQALATALRRFHAEIQRIRVYVENLNGPRGGIDKRCRVEVQMRRGKSFRIGEEGGVWSSVVTRLARRVARHFGRRVNRRPRRSGHKRITIAHAE